MILNLVEAGLVASSQTGLLPTFYCFKIKIFMLLFFADLQPEFYLDYRSFFVYLARRSLPESISSYQTRHRFF